MYKCLFCTFAGRVCNGYCPRSLADGYVEVLNYVDETHSELK